MKPIHLICKRETISLLLLALSYALADQNGLAQTNQANKAGIKFQVQTALGLSVPGAVGGGFLPSAFSPDDKLLLLGAQTPRVWEVATAREVQQLVGHSGEVRAVAFSYDGHSALTSGDDKTLRIWDVNTGKELKRMENQPSYAEWVSFSPDGRRILAFFQARSTKNELRILSATTGALLANFSLDSDSNTETPRMFRSLNFSSFALSPDGLQLLTGHDGGVARLWDLKTGALVRRFLGSDDQAHVRFVAFSPDGNWVLTQDHSTGILWQTITGDLVKEFSYVSPGMVGFTTDGRHVIALHRFNDSRRLGESFPSVEVAWNLKEKREDRYQGKISFTYTPREPLAGSFSRDRRWSFYQSQLFNEEMQKVVRDAKKGAGRITTVTFSPDGRWLRIHLEQDHIRGTWLWETSSGRPIYAFNDIEVPYWGAFSSNGTVFDMSGKMIRVWDLTTRHFVNSFTIDPKYLSGPTVVSYDGRRAIARRPSRPEEAMQLWDVRAGKELRRFGPVNGLRVGSLVTALSSDGSRAASTDYVGGVQVWNTETGAQIAEFNVGGSQDSVAISANGRFVMSTGEHDVSMWDTTTGEKRTYRIHASRLVSADFSPNARWILTKSEENTLEIFDRESGRSAIRVERPNFTRLSDSHQTESFSSDDRFVIFVDRDNSARLFTLESGKEAAAIVHTERGDWAVVSPDGRFDTNLPEGSAPWHWLDEGEKLHALSLDLFMRDYYTPGLLSKILFRQKLPTLPDLASLNRAQPLVKIKQVVPNPSDSSLVDVVVEVQSTNRSGKTSGARDLRLFRGNHLVRYQEGPVALDAKGHAIVTFTNVFVPYHGEFNVYAFNTDRVKSETTNFQFRSGSFTRPEGRAFILAIGVDETPNIPALRLRFAASDAQRLSEALHDRLARQSQFKEVIVSLVTSDETRPDGATKTRIREALAKLAQSVRPQDFVMVSYSGHGYADSKGDFYLIPSDVTQGPSNPPKGAISSTELTEWLRPIDSEQMVLVLDACHSAASVESNGFRPGPMGDPGLGQLAYDKKMRILAATQAANVAFENIELKQGLLTYTLVNEGLEKGKADWRPTDNNVAMGEWLAYGVYRVPSLWADLKYGRIPGASRELVESRSTIDQTPVLFDFTESVIEDVILSRPPK